MAARKPECIFFDSSVYINALRAPEYVRKIEPFLQGAYLYVINKIVLMELWAGVRGETEEIVLSQHQKLFPQKLFPMIGLSDDHFITAGQIMARMTSQMRKQFGYQPKTRRRLTWDILIALSAMENRAVVVTTNEPDFRRIRNFVDFEYLTVGD